MKARFFGFLVFGICGITIASARLASAGPSPSPTASPSPTPNPYRSLDFASATLGDESAGHIEVYGGFAAARRDGKAAIVCVSFKNASSLPARRVVFDFPLMGRGVAS